MTTTRALGLAALITGLAAAAAVKVLGGDDPTPEQPRPSSGRTTVFVDTRQHCDDGRSTQEAQSPATPWCSLTRAMVLAPPRSLVMVRGGPYRALEIPVGLGTRNLTLRASNASIVLEGLETGGVRGLRVEGFRISGGAVISRGSQAIALVRNVIEPYGVKIEAGVRGVRLTANSISAPQGNGVTLSSWADQPVIRDVYIRRNHFDRIGGDGIQAKNFDGLTIEDNEFKRVLRVTDEHPDALQTVFGGRDLVFRSNLIRDSDAGVLIKDGHVDGVVIENNRIVRNRSVWAIMIFDAANVRLVNNTVWDTAYGVILREGVRDAVVANNIFSSFRVNPSATVAYEDYNVIGSGDRRGAHDLGGGVRFSSPTNYGLAPQSAGIDAGTSELAPSRDRLGRGRHDDPSAPNRGGGSRPWIDMGADERAPARPPPTPEL